jgi:TolA-binding protein
MSSHAKSLLGVLAIAVMGLILYSCSSTKGSSDYSADANEFFDPSATIAERQTARVNAEGKRQSGKVEPAQYKKIAELISEQNRRLLGVLRQLRSVDPQFRSGNSAVNRLRQSLEKTAPRTSLTTEAQIADLMRVQNAHLIGILGQLKTTVLKHNAELRQASLKLIHEQIKTDAKPLTVSNPKVDYGNAIRFYEDHKYIDAIVAFEGILGKSADAEMIDNSRFWIGVSLFNLESYEEAIPQFQLLLKHQWFEKREATYIMLGQCYEQTGKRSLAKATYQQLVQLNPVCDLAYVAHLKISML